MKSVNMEHGINAVASTVSIAASETLMIADQSPILTATNVVVSPSRETTRISSVKNSSTATKRKENLAKIGELNYKIRSNLYKRVSNVYDRIRKDLKQMTLNNSTIDKEIQTSPKDNILKKEIPEFRDDNVIFGFGANGDKKQNDKDKKRLQPNKQQQQEEDRSSFMTKEKDLNKFKEASYRVYRRYLGQHGYRTKSESFIAEGGFGTVFRVEKNGKKFACKVISNCLNKLKLEKRHLNTVKMRSRFSNEVDIMNRCSDHPNIISLLDYFEENASVWEVEQEMGTATKNSNKLFIDSNRKKIRKQNGEDDHQQDEEEEETKVFNLLIEESGAGDTVKKQLQQQQNQSPFPGSIFKICYIVMEYADCKTFSLYLKKFRTLNEFVVKEIFTDLIGAISYLHRKRIAHRDIKLSNLLLTRKPSQKENENGGKMFHQQQAQQQRRFNYIVKLGDFGLSSVVDNYDEENINSSSINDNGNAVGSKAETGTSGGFFKPVGTAIYMAPEILRSYYFYSKKNLKMLAPYCAFKGDIWALGVCMFNSLHGFYPLDFIAKATTKQQRLSGLKKIFENPAMLINSDTTTEQRQPPQPNRQSETLNVVDESEFVGKYQQNIQKVLRNYHHRLSSDCKDVLSKMLAVDPRKRATVEELIQHRYFHNNNNTNIETNATPPSPTSIITTTTLKNLKNNLSHWRTSTSTAANNEDIDNNKFLKRRKAFIS